jgi:hypothetical protein
MGWSWAWLLFGGFRIFFESLDLGCRAELVFDVRGGAHPVLKAGAAPRAGLFSLLAQRK